MATEEQKKESQIRMLKMIVGAMSKALFDLLGETAFAVMGGVGDEYLNVMEKEMGLEIAGETPKDVMMEVGRIFVDEIGYINSFKIEEKDNEIDMLINGCHGYDLSKKLLSQGVNVLPCPLMNICSSAFKRMGKPVRKKVAPRIKEKGSKLTFIFVD